MDDYTRYAHSVCRLTYYAVLVTKYRRKTISPELIKLIEEYTGYLIEKCYGGKLMEITGVADHIHILFKLPPTAAPAVIIGNLKTQLSKRVKQEYEDQLWDGSFWSDSYFLTTIGTEDPEVVERYVAEQETPRPKRKYTPRKPGRHKKK